MITLICIAGAFLLAALILYGNYTKGKTRILSEEAGAKSAKTVFTTAITSMATRNNGRLPEAGLAIYQLDISNGVPTITAPDEEKANWRSSDDFEAFIETLNSAFLNVGDCSAVIRINGSDIITCAFIISNKVNSTDMLILLDRDGYFDLNKINNINEVVGTNSVLDGVIVGYI